MSHIHHLVDFTVEVFIVYKNKVLLRKHDKYKIWLSVGGHIELNEDPNQAAIREVKEETGLDIELDDNLLETREQDDTKDLIPPYYLNRHHVTDSHEHITFVYFAKAKTSKITQLVERERSEDCQWFSKEDIVKNSEIKPNIRHYALKALERLLIQ